MPFVKSISNFYRQYLQISKMFEKLISEQQVPEGKDPHPYSKTAGFFFCLDAKKYFQVEEQQIIQRIKSVFLMKPAFRQVIKDQPDIYGPFWIATTLIIIIIASSSITTFFDSTTKYNFDQIAVASGLIYGIAFGCPYTIAILVKIFGGTLSVVHLICVYGYSLAVFLPITMFCFLNSHIVQIILLVIGFVFSSVFLVRGVLSMDTALQQRQRLVICVFILGAQFILVLMYKFYFFQIIT